MNDSPRWISTPEAASILGVNSRAVQKRAARGSLPARKVGERWEINADALDASTTPKMDASASTDGRIADAPDVQGMDVVDASNGANGRVHLDAMDASIGRKVEIELRAQLAREREFCDLLKSQLEAVTQSEAQTKAALREALRAMPKQLTAGDAPASANGAPQRGESCAAGNQGAANASGQQRQAGAPGATDWNSVYANLADELDGRLNR